MSAPAGVAPSASRSPAPAALSDPPGTLAPAWEPAPRGWYAAVAAGVFPPLVLGFVASALANRLAFVGWGAVVAAGHAALLRAAWSRGWSAAARAALTLGWAALGTLSLAGLVARHGEILDLGYRALLWPVYSGAWTRPGTWQVLAAALAAAAAVAALVALRRGRSDA